MNFRKWVQKEPVCSLVDWQIKFGSGVIGSLKLHPAAPQSLSFSRWGSGKLLVQFDRPDSLEVNEVGLHVNTRDCLLEKFCGISQFLLMVLRFRPSIVAESANQPSICSTIRMQHQYYKTGSMEADGFSNLFQDELPISFMLGRCQTLCTSSNLDRI